MIFRFFLVSIREYETYSFTEAPAVSNVLEVEAFLNCADHCTQCQPNPSKALMNCNACEDGFTLESNECV